MTRRSGSSPAPGTQIGRRLKLNGPQRLADYREAFGQGQRFRSIRVPKVKDSHVVKPGPSTDAAPRFLEISERGARVLGRNDPRVVFVTG